jgi:peptidyl-prolyl cis-trans isomerase A (cyclophilin A)
MKGVKRMKTMKGGAIFMAFVIFLTCLIAAGAQDPAEVRVRIETSFGQIDLAIDTKRAPVTSANFLKYVDAGLYDGGRFHRATRPDNYKRRRTGRRWSSFRAASIPTGARRGFRRSRSSAPA